MVGELRCDGHIAVARKEEEPGVDAPEQEQEGEEDDSDNAEPAD